MKTLALIILIVLTSYRITFSQSPPFKQFNLNDGLPSPNVYDCLQDAEGYMWFATENGLSRFDSHNFENFYKHDGLNSLSIQNILAKDDRFYISNRNEGINIYQNKRFKKLNYNSSAWEILKIVLHKNKIYVNGSTYINEIEDDSSIVIYQRWWEPFSKFPVFNIYWLYSFNNERLLAATTDGIYEVKERKLIKLSVNGLDNKPIYHLTGDRQNNIYASSDNVIYKISGDAVVETYKFNFTYEKKIFRILVDHNDLIWFFVMNNGLFKFNPADNHLIELNKKLDVEKLHVTIIYEDKMNNVWVCTFGKGVYCFYNTFINNYNTKDGLSHAFINSVTGDSSRRIYCGTYNGLSILEGNNFGVINSPASEGFTDYIRYVNKVNDRFFILCFSGEPVKYYHDKYKGIQLLYSPWRNSILLADSLIIAGSWSNQVTICNYFEGFTEQNVLQSYFVVGDTLSSNRINGLLKDSKGRAWIASDKGISLLYNNEISVIQHQRLNSQFNTIKEDKRGFIWASGEKGLVILKDSSIVYEFLKDKYDNVRSFEFDNSNRVWLSTMEGLSGVSVQYFKDSLELKREYTLNENTGLVSNDISSIYFDNIRNYLWIGTSNGLSSVDLNKFNEHLNDSLSLSILEISSPDSVYNLNEYITFPDNTKEIAITVSSFDVNSTGNIYYEYELNDEDTVWHRSESNIIKFTSLAHGDYNFQIRAKNNFGKISNASVINFTIDTPFEKSLLFFVLIAFLGMSATGCIIYRSLKKKYIIKSERNSFMNQISELKQKSLASMMNPHFVFNSLNSIQSFYNYKKNEAANDYLARFSRLIRMNLDFADETFIRLSDELERLEYYLLLEKMRFNDKLNYDIWISDDIDPHETHIPNMIIQPFVENAIWHGILKSENNGLIGINIFRTVMPVDIKKDYKIQYHALLNKNPDEYNSDSLYCLKIEITDNGIGYNSGCRNNQSSHISRGVSVTKERLSILHYYSGKTDLVKITDRSELPGNETGTLVEIFLTPNIYKTG